MSRQKYSPELKAQISEEYLSGKESTHTLAKRHGINAKVVKFFIPQHYRSYYF
ncbi:transposase [Lachnoclostridium sp.]|uniref:transposase n=1 Tax=Lachnoclostridium sp. TaxID=2028282 RepID=UPI00289750F1|nr:transposase [Lachnoclostridium sp.]